MSRKFFVGGNWKMNGTKLSVDNIITFLNESKSMSNVDIVIAPPSLYLVYVKEHIKSDIFVAAQNCFKVSYYYLKK